MFNEWFHVDCWPNHKPGYSGSYFVFLTIFYPSTSVGKRCAEVSHYQNSWRWSLSRYGHVCLCFNLQEWRGLYHCTNHTQKTLFFNNNKFCFTWRISEIKKVKLKAFICWAGGKWLDASATLAPKRLRNHKLNKILPNVCQWKTTCKCRKA